MPKLPPGRVSFVNATAGPGSATVNFLGAGHRRPADALHRHALHRLDGADPRRSSTGTPPATSVRSATSIPATSYTFKVQAAQRQRHRSALGRVERRHAVRADGRRARRPASAPAGQRRGDASAGPRRPTAARTITRYTITPYLGGVAQTGDDGHRLARTDDRAWSTGSLNGSAYTFKVTATNAVGDGPDSAASNAVTPNAVAAVRAAGLGPHPTATTLQLTPASAITVGDRMVVHGRRVELTAERRSPASPTRPATRTRRSRASAASDDTELSVWSAPITAGGGTRPTITVTATGSADIGAAALEYAGLSTAAGAAAVDQFKTATGTSSAAGFVTSGPTAAMTGDNGLAIGFYVDSGLRAHAERRPELHASGSTSRPTSDMEFVAEDAPAAARRHAGGARLDRREHALDDGDRRVQERRARRRRRSSVDARRACAFCGHGGRREPGGQDADASATPAAGRMTGRRRRRELAERLARRAGPTPARSP